MRSFIPLLFNLGLIALSVDGARPVGTYARSNTDGDGGLLIFDRDDETLQLVVRLRGCVAAAHDVRYQTMGIADSQDFWLIPDYSSTGFQAALTACNHPTIHSDSFEHLLVTRKGNDPMGRVTVHMGGYDWNFDRGSGYTPTAAPTTRAPPTRYPTAPPTTTPAPSPSERPVGRYDYRQSSNSGVLVFGQYSQTMHISINLNGCSTTVYNVPYDISPIWGHDDMFWVLPDYSSTNFKSNINRCSDSVVHGGSFEQLLVRTQSGVPMGRVTVYVGGSTSWNFDHSSTPITPAPTTTRRPVPTRPRTTPARGTPWVPSLSAAPKGLYEAQSDGVSGQLIFFQEKELFGIHVTLGGCRLYFEDIPYEMVVENGVSWVMPDYSSTSLPSTLRRCGFYANSRYELEDLEKIEFRDAQDPTQQTLTIYRQKRTYGKAQGKIFENQLLLRILSDCVA
ncbi:hypothetical protein FOZ62_031461 [Perkinsus olseni]|uniref:Uncharacterized protein n=1 Tax=Perkinsus olseni TaxID=32597 RepID=A0A7J6P0N0_PEROL|nr:hypothetical protein FOZ62_031461 [Perkinsus olseni]